MTVAIPVDAGVVLPPAAPAGLRPAAPAARSSSPRSRCCGSRPRPARVEDFTDGHASSRCSPTRRRRRRRGRPGAAVPRQGLLRPRGRARQARRHRTAIVRVEQLVPAAGRGDRRGARRATRTPRWSGSRRSRRNQGAWPFMALNLPEHLAERAGRACGSSRAPASASPATGSRKMHALEQQTLRRAGLRPLSLARRHGHRSGTDGRAMYFTDRGIEELAARRGDEEVTLDWLAERLRDVRRPQPGVRDAGRAAGHLAGPPRRRRGLTPVTDDQTEPTSPTEFDPAPSSPSPTAPRRRAGLRRRLLRRRVRRPQGPGLGRPGRRPQPAARTSTSRRTTWASAATPPPTCWTAGATECPPRWRAAPRTGWCSASARRRRARACRPARSRLNLANILDDAAALRHRDLRRRRRRRRSTPTFNDRLEVARRGPGRRLRAPQRAVRRLLRAAARPRAVARRTWRAGDGVHPGQAGYGLIAWLVLHSGWDRLAAPVVLTDLPTPGPPAPSLPGPAHLRHLRRAGRPGAGAPYTLASSATRYIVISPDAI